VIRNFLTWRYIPLSDRTPIIITDPLSAEILDQGETRKT